MMPNIPVGFIKNNYTDLCVVLVVSFRLLHWCTTLLQLGRSTTRRQLTLGAIFMIGLPEQREVRLDAAKNTK